MNERDELAVLMHDATCSDESCEPHAFAPEFKRADAVLDWLATHDTGLRERIAQAIERMPVDYDEGQRDQAAAIARDRS